MDVEYDLSGEFTNVAIEMIQWLYYEICRAGFYRN